MNAVYAWMIVGALAVCGGCGPAVTAIDVHDQRLPLESRQRVGDAEDAVTVADAAIEDARLGVREVDTWRDAVLKGAKAAGTTPNAMSSALKVVAAGRLAVAESRLARAEAERALSRAKLDLVQAEVAMRHDLDVYDLPPLRQAVDRARTALEAAVLAVEQAQARLDTDTTTFWAAFRDHVADGGDAALLWLPEAR